VQFIQHRRSTLEEAAKTGMVMATKSIEYISLSQDAVDKIIQNPPGSECDFNCLQVEDAPRPEKENRPPSP
jgi:hypothetical protein